MSPGYSLSIKKCDKARKAVKLKATTAIICDKKKNTNRPGIRIKPVSHPNGVLPQHPDSKPQDGFFQ